MAAITKPKTEPPQPIHATLTERLQAGHDAAREAWAQSARETMDALFDHVHKGVAGIENRIPAVAHEEDVMRLRAELAEFLRGAAAAIAPRST